jgi:hypothetical protein
MPRSRLLFLELVIGTILLGLALRLFRTDLPCFIGEYAGDTLSAAMVYFLRSLRCLLFKKSPPRLGI